MYGYIIAAVTGLVAVTTGAAWLYKRSLPPAKPKTMAPRPAIGEVKLEFRARCIRDDHMRRRYPHLAARVQACDLLYTAAQAKRRRR